MMRLLLGLALGMFVIPGTAGAGEWQPAWKSAITRGFVEVPSSGEVHEGFAAAPQPETGMAATMKWAILCPTPYAAVRVALGADWQKAECVTMEVQNGYLNVDVSPVFVFPGSGVKEYVAIKITAMQGEPVGPYYSFTDRAKFEQQIILRDEAAPGA